MKLKPFNEHGPKEANMDVGEYCLHGDVIIERMATLPTNFSEGESEPMKALAYGELTGHIHQLQGEPGVDFDLRVSKTGDRHLKIVNPTFLKHQEHSPILLKPGNYKIGIQREYDPFSKMIRQVID